MHASWWMMAGLLVGLVGCRQTELEACEEFAEIACECGDDPFDPAEDENGCYYQDNIDDACSSASEDESSADNWGCMKRKWRKSCDYTTSAEECDYKG